MSESFDKAVEAGLLAFLTAENIHVIPGVDRQQAESAARREIETRDLKRMRATLRAALRAALSHLTADDLRSTPAGRALVAEGKSLGWDDAIGELRKGQGLHRALAGTLSTRKPSYEESTNDHA